MTIFAPVALAMLPRPTGSRPIPIVVTSTIVPPPTLLKWPTSSIASSSLRSRRLVALLNGSYRMRPRLLSETGSYALAFAVASTGGWNTTVKSMKRCSCIEVIPTSAGSMSPRTVLTLPFMRFALLVLE